MKAKMGDYSQVMHEEALVARILCKFKRIERAFVYAADLVKSPGPRYLRPKVPIWVYIRCHLQQREKCRGGPCRMARRLPDARQCCLQERKSRIERVDSNSKVAAHRQKRNWLHPSARLPRSSGEAAYHDGRDYGFHRSVEECDDSKEVFADRRQRKQRRQRS